MYDGRTASKCKHVLVINLNQPLQCNICVKSTRLFLKKLQKVIYKDAQI